MWGRRRRSRKAERDEPRRSGHHPDHLPPDPIPGYGVTPITRPPGGGPAPAVYGRPPWADDIKDR